jgi:hypothetical protein
MHDELWAGIALKLEYARFHLDRMWRSLEPPERTQMNVALEASGAIIDTGWQRSFYPYFDAFLTAARSVPEIINACFGADLGSREMATWFQGLDHDEQDRRCAFTGQFNDRRRTFGNLPLSKARNISVHRTGVAPVTVATTGFFGVTYTGGPTSPIPSTETRQIDDPNLPFLAKPSPLRPMYSDFYFDGQKLEPMCRDYIESAQALVNDARTVVQQVHGYNTLSAPPGIKP